ncbi:hypothetical protein [Trichocoleus sp. FACHB-262]|uniref:hypothetical protein n=1 Tax=Trichocoleus sp. FACHB-262 TaxID=2692869 RepID=UPI0028C41FB9|nr:hypothetical protein [Trichocoleus sp. FACHB-262]
MTKLFQAFESARDRALFGICLYIGCRISETCSMLATDAYDAAGVRVKISLRKANTKGKQERGNFRSTAFSRVTWKRIKRAQASSISFPDGTSRGMSILQVFLLEKAIPFVRESNYLTLRLWFTDIKIVVSQPMKFRERRAIAWGW